MNKDSKLNPDKTSNGKFLVALVVLIAGLLTTGVLFFLVHDYEDNKIEGEFRRLSSDRFEIFTTKLTDILQTSQDTRAFFNASIKVERQEFRLFTEGILKRDLSIVSMDWLPIVTNDKRAEFEEFVRNEGFSNFYIKELDDKMDFVVAGKRDWYVPIYYAEPIAENAQIIGYDVASEPMRKEALERAMRSGLDSATGRIRLNRFKSKEEFGCRIFLPVYRHIPADAGKEDKYELSGFVSTLFSINGICNQILNSLLPSGIDIYLFDQSASKKEEDFLYRHVSRLRKTPLPEATETVLQNNRLRWQAEFNFCGRQWLFVFIAAPEFFYGKLIRYSWLILLFGLMFSLLLFKYLNRIMRYTENVEKEVQERTAELKKANESLKQEVVQRQQAQMQLKAAKDYAELLYKITPSAIFTVDKEKRITSWNDKAAELTGYKAEEVIGKLCTAFANLPCTQQCGLYTESVKKPIMMKECIIKHKDGRDRVILKNADYLKDSNGDIIGGIESFDDITELKKTEEALAAAAKINSDIIENAPFGIYIVNSAGSVEYVNPAMLNMSGATSRQFLEINVFDFQPYKEIGLSEKIQFGLKGNYFKLEGVEYTSFFAKKTTYRNFYGIPLKEPQEMKVLVVVEDITERKRLEQLKDEFVSTVSHELRTPLSIIKEGISQVLDGIHGDINRMQKHILMLSVNNIGRMAHIVDDLLNISKIEAGKLELKKQNFNIIAVVSDIVSSFRIPIQAKGLMLKENFSKAAIEVYADKDKISQVFINLLGNALKFTEKGAIEVGVTDKDSFVECVIADTGIGISEADMPRVFNKFEQFIRTVGVGSQGTGLGLAITKGIVEFHHGRIWLESELGKGTKVFFALPKQKKDG